MPSMNIDLEVKVLWGVGRNDPSEPQGDDRERLAESSGERDLRGDVQKPDRRRRYSGRAGKEPRALATKEWSVNPALVQGQSMSLTWGDLASRLKG